MGHYDPGTSGGTPRYSQDPSLQHSAETMVLEKHVSRSFSHYEHGLITQPPSSAGK